MCEREEEREERLKKTEEDLRQRQATLKEKEGQHLLDQELCRKNKLVHTITSEALIYCLQSLQYIYTYAQYFYVVVF